MPAAPSTHRPDRITAPIIPISTWGTVARAVVSRRELGVKEIARQRRSSFSKLLAVFICALYVMLFVEVPLVALFVRPGGVTARVTRFYGWLTRNGWTLTVGLPLIAAIYAIVTGINTLT